MEISSITTGIKTFSSQVNDILEGLGQVGKIVREVYAKLHELSKTIEDELTKIKDTRQLENKIKEAKTVIGQAEEKLQSLVATINKLGLIMPKEAVAQLEADIEEAKAKLKILAQDRQTVATAKEVDFDFAAYFS